MLVAIAASTAYASPVASPVNTLVMGSGNYSFRDYLRVGIPADFDLNVNHNSAAPPALAVILKKIGVYWSFPHYCITRLR